MSVLAVTTVKLSLQRGQQPDAGLLVQMPDILRQSIGKLDRALMRLAGIDGQFRV